MGIGGGVVGAGWREFIDEIGRWRDTGRLVEFWWRDDDACRADAVLERLLGLASHTGVPLALAAIPGLAEPAAFEALPPGVEVLQHGVDHRNRAAPGEKKSEFPPGEPAQLALDRLQAGREMLERVAPGRVLPVLVPPWNRIAPHLVPLLATGGYRGLSTYGVKYFTNRSALTQANTHVDIIDWKGSRGFLGSDLALRQAVAALTAQRLDKTETTKPIGWLTHHAVHDAESWNFLESLFEFTRKAPGICWRAPGSVFDCRSAREGDPA